MLHKLSGEILLGQLAYRQKTDIYNYSHQYNSGITKKKPCTQLSSEEPMDAVPRDEK